MIIKPGDWVRFQRNGELVLGVVAYVHSNADTYPYKPVAITDKGTVAVDDILEVRRGDE